ncbi:MAG: hypothetical protein KBC02_02740 [Candidatus Pacebacteria bacterium]|nr:hypothetical protein [Candidatus Paceibacterota bacterium]
MEKRFIVFVFDARHPKGGWQDVLRRAPGGDVLFFGSFEEAATAGHAYWKEHFPEHGRFQVIDMEAGKFIGSGGFSD